MRYNYTRCALVRAYPPPFVMCGRVRVVSVCRPLGVLLASDGFGGRPGRFLAGEVVRRCLFVALLSLVCPRWHCGGVCGLVSCFFVAVGSFFGRCQKVACGLDFGLVSVRRRVAVSL